MINLTQLMRAELYEAPGGVVLPYRIYVPQKYDTAKQYPILLYLHGMGERGGDNRLHVSKNSVMETLLLEENRAAYPCVVLAPQCPEDAFWGEGYLPALMGLLEHTRAAYSTDCARQYITGLSMGGFGTWGMLAAYPDNFAAAVPICGGWDMDDDVENVPVMKGVPIWAFHGALDMTVPVARTRDMVKALEAVGGNIKYTEYQDEYHGIAARVYSEPALFPWLFAQSKN